jgi:hypothetical protein
MANPLIGSWTLTGWSRHADGLPVAYPLGPDAVGLLVYAPDGRMAVQMASAHRAAIGGTDPLGGPEAARAAAYAGCLAYFGTYTVEGTTVTHKIAASLFPDWTGEAQVRPFTLDGDRLVLRTPPAMVDGRTTFNEMAWRRAGAAAA